jgi:hypothetical protein
MKGRYKLEQDSGGSNGARGLSGCGGGGKRGRNMENIKKWIYEPGVKINAGHSSLRAADRMA